MIEVIESALLFFGRLVLSPVYFLFLLGIVLGGAVAAFFVGTLALVLALLAVVVDTLKFVLDF